MYELKVRQCIYMYHNMQLGLQCDHNESVCLGHGAGGVGLSFISYCCGLWEGVIASGIVLQSSVSRTR